MLPLELDRSRGHMVLLRKESTMEKTHFAYPQSSNGK